MLPWHVGFNLRPRQAEATRLVNSCIAGLYHNGAFLRPNDAVTFGKQGIKFLRLYASLARICQSRGLRRFPLVPKCHYFNHQFLDLLSQGLSGHEAINPLIFSNQLQEDFIGKPSRLSRRVNPRSAPLRVLQRTLLAIKSCLAKTMEFWKEEGELTSCRVELPADKLVDPASAKPREPEKGGARANIVSHGIPMCLSFEILALCWSSSVLSNNQQLSNISYKVMVAQNRVFNFDLCFSGHGK